MNCASDSSTVASDRYFGGAPNGFPAGWDQEALNIIPAVGAIVAERAGGLRRVASIW